jgi:hypothetical protein
VRYAIAPAPAPVQVPKERRVRNRTRSIIPVVNNNATATAAYVVERKRNVRKEQPAAAVKAQEKRSREFPSEMTRLSPLPEPSAKDADSLFALFNDADDSPKTLREDVAEKGIQASDSAANITKAAPEAETRKYSIFDVPPDDEPYSISKAPAARSATLSADPFLPVNPPASAQQGSYDPFVSGFDLSAPEANLLPAPQLCIPGQNLSNCFEMNDNDLLNGPQIYTPNPMTPLPIAAPVTPTPIAGLEGAAGFGAPPAPQEFGGNARLRPGLSLPEPIVENIPPIAATSEIEDAFNAMLSRDANMPSIPGVQ